MRIVRSGSVARWMAAVDGPCISLRRTGANSRCGTPPDLRWQRGVHSSWDAAAESAASGHQGSKQCSGQGEGSAHAGQRAERAAGTMQQQNAAAAILCWSHRPTVVML